MKRTPMLVSRKSGGNKLRQLLGLRLRQARMLLAFSVTASKW